MINNRYIIKKKLGEGRSKVFSAIDSEFPDKEIAIKFLPVSAKPDERDFFREEFFRIKKFDHPNIIKAFEFGTVVTKDAEDLEIEFGSDFITLEFFPSKELLAYTELIDERRLKQILKQLCAVLYYLHQSNYIYYDLKPENILVNIVANNPQIKLIDFGLAEYQLTDLNIEVKGTAHYIAPELLKKEHHDHTVDLYSLGILLYRIVYGRFPFTTEGEVEIYKAHIEQEFVFPPSKYSKELVQVIKKLLNKDASKRYQNSLQVLEELGVEIDLEITKDFLPAKFFSNRKDAINIIRSYLADSKNNEIYCVKGAEGSGKTALFIELYENFENVILIENYGVKTGIDAVKFIFRKIFYSKVLYDNYSKELLIDLPTLFEGDKEEFIQKIKVFSDSALKNASPIILIDDFNLYDEFVKDVLKEILPVFQINNTKVIVSENSNFDSAINLFANYREFYISHFTDSQLSDFIEISYWQNFPKRELKKIISLYSDLLPGNVKQFIKDLIVLGIIKYTGKEITFSVSKEMELSLRSSNEEIYRIRLSNLTADELKLAQLISSFEIGVEQMVLSGLLGINSDKMRELIDGLSKKNIIDSINISNTPRINSTSFKSYLYSTISAKTKYHLVIANTIRKLFPNFNTIELARQYELAGEFEKSAEVLNKEIEIAEKISAYSYKKSLLEKILGFELNENLRQKYLLELIRTNYKLSDYKAVDESFKKVNFEDLPQLVKDEFQLMEASSLVEMQRIDEAKNILNVLINSQDKNIVVSANIWLAIVEHYQDNTLKALEILNRLKDAPDLDLELKAKVLNLLSMLYFNKGDLIESKTLSLKSLEIYTQRNCLTEMAGILVNLGTINYLLGNIEDTYKNWDTALELNSRIGNYTNKAVIQMNWGISLIENRRFDYAIQKLKNSLKILQNSNNINLSVKNLSNLAEAYLNICDYDNFYQTFNKANSLLQQNANVEEELYILFTSAKFWFIIGNREELIKILDKFEFYSYAKESLNETQIKNYSFIKILLALLEENFITAHQILELMEKIKQDEITQYADIIYFVIEKMIERKNISDALLLLKSSMIKNISEKNSYYSAYRDYLLGTIVYQDRIEGLNSASEYFESAYNQIENESISELTWKVLSALALLFYERGNYHKAKKFRLYAIELLNMISDSISDPKIRNMYLYKKERKETLELLKKISLKLQENEP